MFTCVIWWLMLCVLGIAFIPLTSKLFYGFRDGGWLFSKVLGIVIPGYITWVCVCIGILKFRSGVCVAVTLVCILVNLLLYQHDRKNKNAVFDFSKENMVLIIGEELLFLLLFLGWCYLAGFRPEAYGTEKFMDYGFMAAMMRSETLPAPDMWFAKESINYYYGGQYYAVFLTKLSMTKIEETYNVMRMLVAAMTFVLPFSLVRQIWEDRNTSKAAWLPAVIAGAAVSFAGNMHYVLASFFNKWLYGFLGHERSYEYWFPNSTRYIGYYPAGEDKTIHEFPAYSFVLGDLHAHVVNLLFVFLLVGITYAYIKQPLLMNKKQNRMTTMQRIRRDFLSLPILLFGLLIGIFHFTNYWDFVIYFVVIMAVIVYRNLREGDFSWRYTLVKSVLQGIWIVLISMLTALPFTLRFKTMVSGIALSQNHTSIKQMLIVWGLPFVLCGAFVLNRMFHAVKQRGEQGRFRSIFINLTVQDLYIGGLALCAIGLVLIPEIIYVRDIYEEGFARANTMFKLTYQAFSLFGICMGYSLMHFFTHRSKWLYGFGLVTGVCLFATFGYIVTAGSSWFGDDLSLEHYEGLDATAFLEEKFPTDASAIRWLNEHIEGNPVILEACGDSYSDYQRVSAMTGLPCVLGWYVHEWLWRNDVAQLNQRTADIEAIYTSSDTDYAKQLINQYEISYLYVGNLEREKYSDLSDARLQSYGDVVFSENGTYIVAISR